MCSQGDAASVAYVAVELGTLCDNSSIPKIGALGALGLTRNGRCNSFSWPKRDPVQVSDLHSQTLPVAASSLRR